jgi:hypothetical protein
MEETYASKAMLIEDFKEPATQHERETPKGNLLERAGFDIRREIYRYVLLVTLPIEFDHSIVWAGPNTAHVRHRALDFRNVNCSLFRLSKALSLEALEYFYTQNHFVYIQTYYCHDLRHALLNTLPMRRVDHELQSFKYYMLCISLEHRHHNNWMKTEKPSKYFEAVVIRSADIADFFLLLDKYTSSQRRSPLVGISLNFNLLMPHNRHQQAAHEVLKAIRLHTMEPARSAGFEERQISVDISGDVTQEQVLQIKDSMSLDRLQPADFDQKGRDYMQKAQTLTRKHDPVGWARALQFLSMSANLLNINFWNQIRTTGFTTDLSSPKMQLECALFDIAGSVFTKLKMPIEALVATNNALLLSATSNSSETTRSLYQRLEELVRAEATWDIDPSLVEEILKMHPANTRLQDAASLIRAQRQQKAEL